MHEYFRLVLEQFETGVMLYRQNIWYVEIYGLSLYHEIEIPRCQLCCHSLYFLRSHFDTKCTLLDWTLVGANRSLY